MLGFSLGGGVAVEYVNRYPHFVEKLILINPVGTIEDKKISVFK
jgi:pimeloyl-ACP methyl ester carboxylesterase